MKPETAEPGSETISREFLPTNRHSEKEMPEKRGNFHGVAGVGSGTTVSKFDFEAFDTSQLRPNLIFDHVGRKIATKIPEFGRDISGGRRS